MIRALFGIFFILSALFFWSVFYPVVIKDPLTIAIEPGWSDERIIEELDNKNILRSVIFSRIYLLITSTNDSLQAGSYKFEGNVSAYDLFSALVAGSDEFREKNITFIEGWTMEDMASYLEREGIIEKTAFIEGAKINYGFPSVSRLPKGRTLEGYLFPDTYRVFHDITAEELVRKMLENFELKVTDEMRNALIKDGRTLDEAIILASILEREVKTYEDKGRASGVFLNRLKAGIPLQADSTVNYITGKSTPRASSEDITVDSPYNTYKYRGLPPGPISNPGLDSIKAAIYPEKNGYYYFLTTPDGHAIFSKTLDEHNINKRRYYP